MDSRPALPPIVCVVGFKDTGKTGVAVRLVHELRRRGYRVGAVKHGHRFRLDTPGTDSWRLRHEGGAERVLLAGPRGFALMGEWGPGGEPDLEALVRTHFPDAEVVVAEGFKHDAFPKLEVYRPSHNPDLVYQPAEPGADLFLALVTNATELEVTLPLIPLDDPGTPARLADLVEDRVMGRDPVAHRASLGEDPERIP